MTVGFWLGLAFGWAWLLACLDLAFDLVWFGFWLCFSLVWLGFQVFFAWFLARIRLCLGFRFLLGS